MMCASDENYRLICARRGQSWQVEKRMGPFWCIGDLNADLDAAIQSATDKFAAEYPQVSRPVSKPEPAKSLTDLSDLFV